MQAVNAVGTETETDLSSLSAQLRLALSRLVRRLRSEYGFGLTQAAVLGRLYSDGPQCIGELATAEHVRPQSMSQTLADMENCGLIARSPDAADGRRTSIELTRLGRREFEAVLAARDDWLAGEIAKLSDADQEALRAAVPLLVRLALAS